MKNTDNTLHKKKKERKKRGNNLKLFNKVFVNVITAVEKGATLNC
jgi:hypothetical protein